MSNKSDRICYVKNEEDETLKKGNAILCYENLSETPHGLYIIIVMTNKINFHSTILCVSRIVNCHFLLLLLLNFELYLYVSWSAER